MKLLVKMDPNELYLTQDNNDERDNTTAGLHVLTRSQNVHQYAYSRDDQNQSGTGPSLFSQIREGPSFRMGQQVRNEASSRRMG